MQSAPVAAATQRKLKPHLNEFAEDKKQTSMRIRSRGSTPARGFRTIQDFALAMGDDEFQASQEKFNRSWKDTPSQTRAPSPWSAIPNSVPMTDSRGPPVSRGPLRIQNRVEIPLLDSRGQMLSRGGVLTSRTTVDSDSRISTSSSIRKVPRTLFVASREPLVVIPPQEEPTRLRTFTPSPAIAAATAVETKTSNTTANGHIDSWVTPNAFKPQLDFQSIISLKQLSTPRTVSKSPRFIHSLHESLKVDEEWSLTGMPILGSPNTARSSVNIHTSQKQTVAPKGQTKKPSTAESLIQPHMRPGVKESILKVPNVTPAHPVAHSMLTYIKDQKAQIQRRRPWREPTAHKIRPLKKKYKQNDFFLHKFISSKKILESSSAPSLSGVPTVAVLEPLVKVNKVWTDYASRSSMVFFFSFPFLFFALLFCFLWHPAGPWGFADPCASCAAFCRASRGVLKLLGG